MTTLIAHRGASAEAPENTQSSILRAIELTVDCIEIDLHLTKDGELVVIHDSSLKRTTNCAADLSVEDLTLKELRQWDAGSWFSPSFAKERIPTLQEVLEINRGKIRLMIELKTGKTAPELMAEKTLEKLSGEHQGIILGSFDPLITKALQTSAYPLIGIAEELSMIPAFLDQGIKHLALWSKILDPHLIESLHEKDIIVWTFTVDDEKSTRLLRAAHIDGIITNNPKKIQGILKSSS